MTTSTLGIWGALSLSLLALGARAERLPFQADVDLCAKRAVEHGDRSISGSVRLQIMIRADGKVYAAYMHSTKGVDDKVFEYCLASNALLWQYPPVGLDTSAPFPISVTAASATTGSSQSAQSPPQVFLPSEHPDVEPGDLDVPRAQATLNVLEDCSRAERGQAALAVHQYADALSEFRSALEKDPNDRSALRGLAQALAESHGDLEEARAAAKKLASIAPDSVVGAEAMFRVCWAAKDDACVLNSWKQARVMHDAGARKQILTEELMPLAQKAALRLQAAAEEKRSQAAAEAREPKRPGASEDPCGAESEPNQQAICEVKRCLDSGSALYAQEISKGGTEFEISDWRFKEVGKDRLLATRPIASKAKDGAVEHRDALFVVTIGDHFSIKPSSGPAKEIARDHNACAKPQAPAPAPN